MPQLGETVAEGKIVKWFKSAGDAVKPGDNLFEIETDKVSVEVPSITAGTLTEIKVQAGDVGLGVGGGRGRARRGRGHIFGTGRALTGPPAGTASLEAGSVLSIVRSRASGN